MRHHIKVDGNEAICNLLAIHALLQDRSLASNDIQNRGSFWLHFKPENLRSLMYRLLILVGCFSWIFDRLKKCLVEHTSLHLP